jgi:hypothetical protein
MGVEHIIANLVLQQFSSALLCSRLLFVGSLFRCLFLAFRVIGIIQLSWSQFLWAFLEQITWKAVVYPRDPGTCGTPNPLSHADFVAPKMTFRWLRIYESIRKVLNDPPLVRRK